MVFAEDAALAWLAGKSREENSALYPCGRYERQGLGGDFHGGGASGFGREDRAHDLAASDDTPRTVASKWPTDAKGRICADNDQDRVSHRHVSAKRFQSPRRFFFVI